MLEARAREVEMALRVRWVDGGPYLLTLADGYIGDRNVVLIWRSRPWGQPASLVVRVRRVRTSQPTAFWGFATGLGPDATMRDAKVRAIQLLLQEGWSA